MLKQIAVGLLVVGVGTLACKKDDAAKQSSGAQKAGQESGPPRVKRGVLVARALGAMGPLRNTNSIEAFKCNYDRGFRWFEVDLALTSDNELVCFHKGDEKLFWDPANHEALCDYTSPWDCHGRKVNAGDFGRSA